MTPRTYASGCRRPTPRRHAIDAATDSTIYATWSAAVVAWSVQNRPLGSSEWGGRPINIGRPRPPARCGRPRGETDHVGIESPGDMSLASLTRGRAATHEPGRPSRDAHQGKRGGRATWRRGAARRRNHRGMAHAPRLLEQSSRNVRRTNSSRLHPLLDQL
jgi:hypothetical protein